ncbi:hypothetical protein [Gordonia neofelifaecis]|nr:hypothetical protein [Gordonia neofelifaecis]
MGSVNTPEVYYLEDSRSAYVRITLTDDAFGLIGQSFSGGSEYEWGRTFDVAGTRQLSEVLGLPLDDHFLEAVADRFGRSYRSVEGFIVENDLPHKFWSFHDWAYDE